MEGGCLVACRRWAWEGRFGWCRPGCHMVLTFAAALKAWSFFMGLVKLPCPRLWAAPGLKQAKAVNLLLSSVKFLPTHV